MPDRSSSQGLPDEWSRGNHAARGQHSSGGTANGYGARTTGSHRAGADGGFGGPATEEYRTGNSDAYLTRMAASPFGTANADPFGEAADSYGPGQAGTGTEHADAGQPAAAIRSSAPDESADSRGFLGALFDFGFTSFVTPKVIRVLYLLIVIGTVVGALAFTIVMFKVSMAAGVLTLILGDPLFVLIVLAVYRIILEFFVVTFRVAEDIRALRERGELR